MGLAAMMANIMSQDKIFAGDKQRFGMAFNPDYKPARDRKELRKFRIKGEEVEAYDIDELKNNWNHWVRTGEILFTPGNGRW